jgi:hypothetical protein
MKKGDEVDDEDDDDAVRTVCHRQSDSNTVSLGIVPHHSV